MKLVWSQTFIRTYKKRTRRHRELQERVKKTIELLAQDPMNPRLRSHKLKGELENVWACTIDYDNRLLFEIIRNDQTGEMEIFLLTLGTHDEVY